MQLAERHIINKKHCFYKELDEISFLSKNLYNRANYIVRQEFISTTNEKEEGKRDKANWIRYNKLQKQLQDDKDYDYYKLPAKVSQHVLRMLDKNWVSFFNSIKDWKNNPSKYTGRPRLPRYKHKKNGRAILIYTIQAISKKELKNGYVLLSGTNIKIKTNKNIINDIQQVRVVPKLNHYVIEVIYNKQQIQYENLDKSKIAGIDLGLNNLMTVTSNQKKIKPLLINGKPLKSINQYYNKNKAKLQSFVPNKTSNKIIKLTNKRNRKIDNYLHKVSRMIVDYFISNEIGSVIIGHNKQWKSEINIGKANNQNFVNVPHSCLIHMIKYKCELSGVDVYVTEESYTSKCSFIDFEDLNKQENYLGKRKHRGLFVSKNGTKINADCNGSGNIIRKVFPNAFADGIEGVVVRPIRVTPYKQAA